MAIKIKPGVQFSVIAPGGMRILEVLKQIAAEVDFDLTITSGTDGTHSGPLDPHKMGSAYDVRSKSLTAAQKALFLEKVKAGLGPRFFAFLEAPGTSNEHFHIQRKKGTVYTIEQYFQNA